MLEGCTNDVDAVVLAVSQGDTAASVPLDCDTTVTVVTDTSLGSQVILMKGSGGKRGVVSSVSCSGTEREGMGSTGLEGFKLLKYS